jgi:hypothetical protein
LYGKVPKKSHAVFKTQAHDPEEELSGLLNI